MDNTKTIAAGILLAPFALGILTGSSGNSIMVLTILGSMPILIGFMAQRTRGRTGAAWWFLSLVVMTFFYFLIGMLGSIGSSGEGDAVNTGLAGAVLFGALPLSIVVYSLPRRRLLDEDEVEKLIEQHQQHSR
jgi:hypothetical protein